MDNTTESPSALEYLIRTGGAVVVVSASILLAVVESFLVPIRFAQSYWPVAAVVAVAGNVLLPLVMLYLTRVRALALLPGLAWFVVVITASTATSENDLIIPDIWPGLAMLVAGAGTIAVMGYMLIAGNLGRRR